MFIRHILGTLSDKQALLYFSQMMQHLSGLEVINSLYFSEPVGRAWTSATGKTYRLDYVNVNVYINFARPPQKVHALFARFCFTGFEILDMPTYRTVIV